MSSSIHISKSRTLSEEFHSKSPNTRQNIKFFTGGTSPTSKGHPVQSHNRDFDDAFLSASPNTKEMLIGFGLISHKPRIFFR